MVVVRTGDVYRTESGSDYLINSMNPFQASWLAPNYRSAHTLENVIDNIEGGWWKFDRNENSKNDNFTILYNKLNAT